jgi:hypothetical protein
MRLYFLCEFTCGGTPCYHRTENAGVLINKLSENMKTLAKVVKGTLMVLKGASLVRLFFLLQSRVRIPYRISCCTGPCAMNDHTDNT